MVEAPLRLIGMEDWKFGQSNFSMDCPQNVVNGLGLKVNTAKKSSEKGEDGTHPPLSHNCAQQC